MNGMSDFARKVWVPEWAYARYVQMPKPMDVEPWVFGSAEDMAKREAAYWLHLLEQPWVSLEPVDKYVCVEFDQKVDLG